ncbi:hypothetical protein BN1110_03782 [bacterium YEK0313]|nr:hypothetical protein BN1110_03782 [bacterium YEK0313]
MPRPRRSAEKALAWPLFWRDRQGAAGGIGGRRNPSLASYFNMLALIQKKFRRPLEGQNEANQIIRRARRPGAAENRREPPRDAGPP